MGLRWKLGSSKLLSFWNFSYLKDGALSVHLHFVTMQVSLTRLRQAKVAKKIMKRREILVRVLQWFRKF